MDNYIVARDRAREYFLGCDLRRILLRPGVTSIGEDVMLRFLGSEIKVSRQTGIVTCAYPDGTSWEGDFSECLSIYDWLCDARFDVQPSESYCPVHSLPGILLGGNGGLSMGDKKLCGLADKNPDAFRAACEFLGGESYPAGEIGYKLSVFPNLSVILKFYHSDEDFPAQLTVLWDRNTLELVKYETTYYIAGVLFRRIRQLMQ